MMCIMSPQEATHLAEKASTQAIVDNYGTEWEGNGDAYEFARGALAASRAMLALMGVSEDEPVLT